MPRRLCRAWRQGNTTEHVDSIVGSGAAEVVEPRNLAHGHRLQASPRSETGEISHGERLHHCKPRVRVEMEGVVWGHDLGTWKPCENKQISHRWHEHRDIG